MSNTAASRQPTKTTQDTKIKLSRTDLIAFIVLSLIIITFAVFCAAETKNTYVFGTPRVFRQISIKSAFKSCF
jgi:hypothetical protein